MAVPTAITDLSATIASNVPAGTDQAFPYLDDYLRAAYGFIRQGDTKAADVASAATVDLGAVVGRFVDVTGTTTITSFGTVSAGIWRIVRFTGALTLTYNATSLILPGAANITTAAGDCCIAVSLGSGNWLVPVYQTASTKMVVASYTPTITASSSNPTVGNGSVSGSYVRNGAVCTAYAAFNYGSTSAAGSGTWRLSLPFAATASAIGVCRILDSGTIHRTGVCTVANGASYATMIIDSTDAEVTDSAPITWANGDVIGIQITYAVA